MPDTLAPPPSRAEMDDEQQGFWPRFLLPLGCVPLIVLLVVPILLELLRATGLGEDAAESVTQVAGSLTILVLALLIRQKSPSHRRRLTTAAQRASRRSLLVGVPIGLAMTAIAVTIIWAGTAVDHNAEQQLERLSDLSVPSPSVWQKVLLGVALMALAPLGEELLFRGLILRALVTRMPFHAAAPISGALFAASHPDAWLLWPRAVALLMLGTVLALTYRRFGYRGSVAAHATVNTLAFLSLLAAS